MNIPKFQSDTIIPVQWCARTQENYRNVVDAVLSSFPVGIVSFERCHIFVPDFVGMLYILCFGRRLAYLVMFYEFHVELSPSRPKFCQHVVACFVILITYEVEVPGLWRIECNYIHAASGFTTAHIC